MSQGKRNKFQPGEEFGFLTIRKRWTECYTPGRSKETICECECKCGKIITCPAAYFARGHKKSCGCLQYQTQTKNKKWKGCGEISGSYWSTIKKNNRNRGESRPVEITIEQAWELFLKQDRRCALSGVELTFPTTFKKHDGTASLDRINSDKGYTLDNVQWVHKDINWMKHTYTQQEFIEWCRKVAENNPR